MKKIVFLTGSRADYGKQKSLMKKIDILDDYELHIYATGMHALRAYGYTALEIYKDNFPNVFVAFNQNVGDSMDFALANTISNFGQYVGDLHPNFIVVHGDRIEALAGAIVGSLRNIPVIHVEGGEVSGTVDESIRHTISKLAHIHMVANEDSRRRIIQLGEDASRVFAIGSPETDIMLSDDLLSFDEVKNYYEIPFKKYAILLYHPVTTLSKQELNKYVHEVVEAVSDSDENYIVIYPNNDHGCEIILNAYQKFKSCSHVKLFSSIRFEWFLTLLQNCEFILGNSSCGIREASVYAKYAINLGSRQNGRCKGVDDFIIHCKEDRDIILSAIQKVKRLPQRQPVYYWGNGSSAENFLRILSSGQLDDVILQKQFVDLLDEHML